MATTKKANRPTREETKAATEMQAPSSTRQRPRSGQLSKAERERGNRNAERRVAQLKALRPDSDGNMNEPKLSLKDAVGEVFFIKSMRIINTREFGEQYLIKIIHIEDEGDNETDKIMWAEPGGSRDELFDTIKSLKGKAEIFGPYTVEAVDRYRLIRLATEREMERAGVVPF